MKHSRKLALLAAAVALTGLVLSGCSGGGSPEQSGKPGGTFTVAGPYVTESLDPHGAAGAAAGTVLAAQSIFSRVVKVNSDGEVAGDLAEKWDVNEDATEWTFTLREGVEFSDGTPFSADDVAGSFNRVQELKGPVAGNFTNVTATASDATHVTFTAEQPEPALLGKLSLLYITKGDATDADFTKPVGTGPYKVEDYSSGENLTLVPNDKYYGTVPVVDELVFRNIPETAARLTALQTGEIQATWGVPDDQVAALKSNSDLVVETVPSTSVVTMWFNSSRPALEDAAVRNALWQAVDFDTIISSLFPETGTPSKGVVAENVLGFAEYSPKKYDPDAAKAALQAAGFDFDQKLEIQYSGATYRQFVESVASDLAKIGVNAVPTEKEAAVFLEDLLALKWDINFQALSTPSFDAATNLGRLYPCAAERTGYCNADLDALLKSAGSTSDQDARKDLYAQAGQIIWDEAVGMYPMALGIVYAWNKDVHGLIPDPSFVPDLSTVSLS